MRQFLLVAVAFLLLISHVRPFEKDKCRVTLDGGVSYNLEPLENDDE
jgi:hypothetical protein